MTTDYQETAVEKIRQHFINKIGKPIRKPYYLSQLQILYETDYFPWVISDAIKKLIEEGFLGILDYNDIPELKRLKNVQKLRFIYNRSLTDLKLVKKHAMTIAKLVNNYSDPNLSAALGRHLEFLVKYELRAQGFKIVGMHTNEYNAVKWDKTDHNLDFIAEHKTGKLVIGVEVKNTLDLIEREEIDIKMDICKKLGITPIFAVRWLKPYINYIRERGGFSWIFKTQIYPFGYEGFVKNLYNKLSVLEKCNSRGKPLMFPVAVRGELPEKSIQKFQAWLSARI